MRISDQLMFAQQQQGIAQNRQRVDSASVEESSGLKVVQPGDDPGGSAAVIQQRLAMLSAAAVGTSATQATDELQAANGALDSLSNILSQAQQLAVQFSNSTYNASDLSTGASQVGSLIQSAIGLLNTQYGSRYLFGGTADSAAPFDSSGNYLGNSQVRTLQLGNGTKQQVSIQADVAVKGAGGGVDVLSTLQALQAALAGNNPTAVNATLSSLQQGVNQVATANAQSGTEMDALQAATTLASSQQTQGTTNISQIEDADAFSTATQLSMAQEGLQAAIAAASSSSQISLLQTLK